MHLDHKVPWNTIASHFTFTKAGSSSNYDLVALGLPGQTAAISHFSRVFVATIKEFSDTEIVKIKSNQASGKLFSDRVLNFAEYHFGLHAHCENSALNNPLTASYQDLEYWKSRTETSEYGTHYSSHDGDLADAAKMLVIVAAVSDDQLTRREALSALIRLSTQVPISDLRNLGCGHGFGLSLVAGVALEVYVLLNLIEAVQSRGTERVSLLRVERLLRFLGGYALQNYDYPAQNIPHRAFWNSLGVTDSWTGKQQGLADIKIDDGKPIIDPLAPEDGELYQKARNDLQRYLKDCFAILYVYDVFLKQASRAEEAQEFWSYEISGILRMLGYDLED
ncbi:hypothetical protein FDECE_5507 [Fusarium decemcellulare]|nr:hypothetical protein FDECE_5507 [Fusarium decemcellulare]